MIDKLTIKSMNKLDRYGMEVYKEKNTPPEVNRSMMVYTTPSTDGVVFITKSNSHKGYQECGIKMDISDVEKLIKQLERAVKIIKESK